MKAIQTIYIYKLSLIKQLSSIFFHYFINLWFPRPLTYWNMKYYQSSEERINLIVLGISWWNANGNSKHTDYFDSKRYHKVHARIVHKRKKVIRSAGLQSLSIAGQERGNLKTSTIFNYLDKIKLSILIATT